MKKRLFLSLLTLSLVFLSQVVSAQKSSAGDDNLVLKDGDKFTALTAEGVEMLFQVLSTSDMTCRVGTGSSPAISQITAGVVTIPSVVNGYTVTKIANRAFKECTKLTQVIIPNTVSDIGTTDFGSAMGPFHCCSGIMSFEIPSSVTIIGRGAFTGCINVTELKIPESVTVIGSNAFDGCSELESIELSPNITAVYLETFRNCKSLTSIVIPASVTTIDNNAFKNCTSLTSVTSYIEQPFTIPVSAFTNYDATLYIPVGTETDYRALSAWNKFLNIVEGSPNNYEPEAYAVLSADNTTLTFYYDDMKDIREGTVYTKLNNMYDSEWYGKSFTTVIYDKSFADYDGLKDISFWFCKCGNLKTIEGLENLNVDNVTNMSYMFYGCSNLTSLDLHSFNTSNVSNTICMFSGCSSLAVIYVGSSWSMSNVEKSTNMFSNCTSLVGGDGTVFSIDYTDKTKAYASPGGYLTIMGQDNSVTQEETGWYTLIEKMLTLNGSPLGEYMMLRADGYLVWNNKSDGNLTVKTFIDAEDSNTLLFDGQSGKYLKITFLEDKTVQMLDGDGIRRTLTSTGATASTPTTGNTFTALTAEGVEMLFQVLSTSDMTCRVGTGSSPAISQVTAGVVTIPSVVNGYTVTKIANRAFKECTKLTQVIIPNTVSDIGTTDFESAMGPFHGCSGIMSFEIPSSVTIIGRGAFTGCINVTELKIPESVTVIGSNAFDHCTGLKSVELSPFITAILWETFRNCTSLESIEIPGSVNSIGYNAFQNCKSLKTITSYIENPFTFQQNAFTSYTATLYVPMGTKEKYQGTSYWNKFQTVEEFDDEADAFTFTSSKGLTYIVIGHSSTVSVKAAFTELSGAVMIPEVVMNSGKPYTVVTIKTGGFEGCASMEKLTIAKTVTNIGAGAFVGCTNLTTLDVAAGSPYTSVDGVLYAEYMTRLVAFPAGRSGDFELPKSVTAISDGAFAGCSKLTSLTVTQGKPIALKADGGVFDGMDFDACELHVPLGSGSDYRRSEGWKLFKHVIDDSEVQVAGITYSIGENGKLTQTGADGALTIGDYTVPSTITIDGTEYEVTAIAPNAFEGCTGMISLTIPESITSIGDHAFAGCTGLEEIYCYSSVPINLGTLFARSFVRTYSGMVPTQFEGIDFENCILYVPFGTSGLYREAEGWRLFHNIVELPVGELTFGDVNCDNVVNDVDIDLTVSHIMGHNPSGFVRDAADVNHDGVVNIVDVTILIRMFINKKP